jgi:release factor glutamine methyltransferase
MIAPFLKQGANLLLSHAIVSEECSAREARILLAASLQQVTGRVLEPWQLVWGEVGVLEKEVVEVFLELCAQRASGMPLQYLTQCQGFYDHDYVVRPGVLIPRPETEQLLEQAIARVQERFSSGLGWEIGLGSGVLSIELLAFFPQLRMQASECSETAFFCAQENAQRILGKDARRLEFLRARGRREVWEPFEGKKADFLISNPPYLDRSCQEQEVEPQVLLYEPEEALFPEGDCLFFYRSIAKRVWEFLHPDGMIFLEIPHERAEEIAVLFGHWKTQIFYDLNQRPRVLVVELSHG